MRIEIDSNGKDLLKIGLKGVSQFTWGFRSNIIIFDKSE